VTDLHLDERLVEGREVIGKHLATGQKKVSTALNTLWADVEVMRETQRGGSGEKEKSNDLSVGIGSSIMSVGAGKSQPDDLVYPLVRCLDPTLLRRCFLGRKAPDLTQAQAQVQAASSRAGAYLSSWGSWAAEKRRPSWNRNPSAENPASFSSPPSLATPNVMNASMLSEAESIIAAERNAWVEVDRNRLATPR